MLIDTWVKLVLLPRRKNVFSSANEHLKLHGAFPEIQNFKLTNIDKKVKENFLNNSESGSLMDHNG